MANIRSGNYAPDHSVVVTHWPLPDAQGDGAEVWDGENIASDQNGNAKRHYLPPDGFEELDTMDNGVKVGATWVRKEYPKGPVKRTPSGEAVNIYPGETLIEHKDGSVRKLKSDAERRAFLNSHSAVD
jgi:hypothetical protein